MEIIRANYEDTDVFCPNQLKYGACCFYTEDRLSKYFFKINGHEAIIFTNTKQYIQQAIDEFLFYSSFITSIKDEHGNIILTRQTVKPYLYDISKIQPSQFYINKEKLENSKKWIKSPEDIIIPIIIKDDRVISLDGHTRIKAAIDLGYTQVYIYPDDYDQTIFLFIEEAIKRNIHSVYDMELVSAEDYKIKWDKFCDDLFANLK